MSKAGVAIGSAIEQTINASKTHAHDSIFASTPERRAELEQEARLTNSQADGLKRALSLVNYHCKCED